MQERRRQRKASKTVTSHHPKKAMFPDNVPKKKGVNVPSTNTRFSYVNTAARHIFTRRIHQRELWCLAGEQNSWSNLSHSGRYQRLLHYADERKKMKKVFMIARSCVCWNVCQYIRRREREEKQLTDTRPQTKKEKTHLLPASIEDPSEMIFGHSLPISKEKKEKLDSIGFQWTFLENWR